MLNHEYYESKYEEFFKTDYRTAHTKAEESGRAWDPYKEIPPVFEIFSDRIQITSYGGLPMGLSKEEFFNCRSMSRNRELMRVFKDVGLVEQLGSGMSRILKVYDRTIFDISENFLVVTFKFEKAAIKKRR